MAVPTFQAAGAAAAGVGAVSPAWPAHQAGDIALLITQTTDFHSGQSTNTHFAFTDMAGFREVAVTPAQAAGTGTNDPVPRADSSELRVFWKRATGSAEPAPQIADSGDHTWAKIITFRGGASSGHPIHKAASRPGWTPSETVHSIPGFTTTDADCLIVDIVASSGSKTYSGWTNASLAALTERVDESDNNGNSVAVGISTGSKAAAGVVNATSVTASFSTHMTSVKLALTPSNSEVAHKAPYLVNVGDRVTSTSGNITVPWPPHQAGDVAVLIVESPSWPVALGTPAGFTEMTGSPKRGGTNNTDTATSLNVYWCRANSSAMASPVATFVSRRISGIILLFRGCIAGGVPYEVTAGNALASASATVSIPGAVTTKNDQRVVAIVSSGGSDLNAKYIGEANANLDACIGLMNYSMANPGARLFVAHGRKAVAGDYGSTTTNNLSSPEIQARFSFSLLPVSSDLVGATGVFQTVGEPASLLYNRVLKAEAGIFSEAAIAAQLTVVHGYVINGETGVYATSGFPIGLHKVMSGGWSREDELRDDEWVKQSPPLEES